ncbi:MAG: metallophosphoesterase [Ardenticatenales bacterium]|nr:metallophosphoesterase [Ardenticatenales bacterium]
MKALVISDKVIEGLYSPAVRQRFAEVELVISCGDLPYYYLEYLISTLDKPLFSVRGNHASVVEYGSHGERTEPWGAIDLDQSVVECNGLILAGFEGSMRYNEGPFQYSDQEMRWRVAQMLPQLFLNRALRGRYLDVLVTHAPPRGVQDQPDRCHTGFQVFRWFLQRFEPRYMLHGHIHVYHPNIVTRSLFHKTEVINCYGYRELELCPIGSSGREGRKQEEHGRSARPRRLREGYVEGFLESDSQLADETQQ